MVSTPTPLGTSHFTLNALGLAGLFGGSETIDSLVQVCVHPSTRLWGGGWYNSPGSYFLGKHLARIAPVNPILNIISKSDEDSEKKIDPAELFKWDGLRGPKFRGIHSRTTIDDAGHFATLFLKECANRPHNIRITDKKTSTVDLVVADLHHIPKEEVPLRFPTDTRAYFVTLLIIIISVATGASCAYFRDWYCFSVISFGILVNGFSHIVIGSGKLIFTHPPLVKNFPLGNGFLTTAEQIVWLRGKESAVNSVTRGKFALRFNNDRPFRPIGICSILLFLQSIAQFILVPQGSLFGQLMFSASIVISWAYNLCRSLNREKIQKKMVMDDILDTPTLTKYTFDSRTSLAVFVALSEISKSEEILNYLLPNDTVEWNTWKTTIVGRLQRGEQLRFSESDWNGSEVLENLYKDAQSAYEGYSVNRLSQSPTSHPPS